MLGRTETLALLSVCEKICVCDYKKVRLKRLPEFRNMLWHHVHSQGGIKFKCKSFIVCLPFGGAVGLEHGMVFVVGFSQPHSFDCVCDASIKPLPGPWHSAPCVLSSFVSLVWNTDFSIYNRYQRIWCHTTGDRTRQEAGSWTLSPAPMVSDNFWSWWRYFFNLSNLIASGGLWYFQVYQRHGTLWKPQKPFQLRVLVLRSKKQPSCDKCLLRILLPYAFAVQELTTLQVEWVVLRNTIPCFRFTAPR